MTARDAARRRVGRTTQLAVAATLAVGGVFASLAAGSTHFTKSVVRQTRKVTTKTVVQAPAPPLVAVQGSSGAAAPPPPQPVAPAATSQAPVVVSGGS